MKKLLKVIIWLAVEVGGFMGLVLLASQQVDDLATRIAPFLISLFIVVFTPWFTLTWFKLGGVE